MQITLDPQTTDQKCDKNEANQTLKENLLKENKRENASLIYEQPGFKTNDVKNCQKRNELKISAVSQNDEVPSKHPPTLVSTHKLVLKIPQSGRDSTKNKSSDIQSGKSNDIDEVVNVKEIAHVFEHKKRIGEPLTKSVTHNLNVPPSPNKIKSMAAIFEQKNQ